MPAPDVADNSNVRDRFDAEASVWQDYHDERVGNIIAWEVLRRKQIAAATLRARFAGRPARILELGCGAGKNLEQIIEIDPQWSAVGVDISPVMVETCRQTYADNDRLSFDVLDLEKGALDERFDAVILLGVVGYFTDNATAFANIDRMLKPGGTLLFTVGKKPSVSRWLRTKAPAIVRAPVIGPVLRLIKAGLLRRPVSSTTKRDSFFRTVSMREIRRVMPESIAIDDVVHVAFAAGWWGRLSVNVGRAMEKVFGRFDPLGLALTTVVTATKSDAAPAS